MLVPDDRGFGQIAFPGMHQPPLGPLARMLALLVVDELPRTRVRESLEMEVEGHGVAKVMVAGEGGGIFRAVSYDAVKHG